MKIDNLIKMLDSGEITKNNFRDALLSVDSLSEKSKLKIQSYSDEGIEVEYNSLIKMGIDIKLFEESLKESSKESSKESRVRKLSDDEFYSMIH